MDAERDFRNLLKDRYGKPRFEEKSPYVIEAVTRHAFKVTEAMEKSVPRLCSVLKKATAFQVRFSRDMDSHNYVNEDDETIYQHLEIKCFVLFWKTKSGDTKCWWLDDVAPRNFSFDVIPQPARKTDPQYLQDWYAQTCGWSLSPPGGYSSKEPFESDLPVVLNGWNGLLDRPIQDFDREDLLFFREITEEFDVPGAADVVNKPRRVSRDAAGNYLVTSESLDDLWLYTHAAENAVHKDVRLEPYTRNEDESHTIYRITEPFHDVQSLMEYTAAFIQQQL